MDQKKEKSNIPYQRFYNDDEKRGSNPQQQNKSFTFSKITNNRNDGERKPLINNSKNK